MSETTAIVPYSHEKIEDDTKTEIVIKYEDSRNKINPKDPKLLDTIARRYSSKITGEINNIKTLVCAFVSKDLPKDYRLSIIIASNSSAGKSYLLNNVLAPFKDDLIDFTDFTEAYFKRAYNNVDGKIIKLEQLERNNDNNQLSIQKLKHLLTEGKIKFGVVDKNEKNGNSPKEFTVTGFPVFVTTSTKFEIDPETANRVFMVQLDEGDEQTQKIIRHTLNKYSKLGSGKEWDSNLQDLADFFGKLKLAAKHVEGIVIPFADKIEELLPKRMEIRRDLNKILNLTCVIAFIHSLNRPQIVHKEGKTFIKDQWNYEKEYTYTIIAKPEDFYEAVEIAGDTIKQTINKSSKILIEFYDQIKRIWNDKPDTLDAYGESKYLTVKEVHEKTGYSQNRAGELLRLLQENGFVTRDYSQREHKYYLIPDKKFQEIKASSITFTQDDFDSWIKTNVQPHQESFSTVGSWDSGLDTKSTQFTSEFEENSTTTNISCDCNNLIIDNTGDVKV